MYLILPLDSIVTEEGGLMLVVHRLSAGGHRYYLAAVSLEGGESPERGEAPGEWWGAGAAERGLTATVGGRELRGLLPRQRGRIPGFDLTFAAPKSVSVLHGLAPEAVAAAVRRAHDAGVDAGLFYLQRHACGVRAAGRLVPGSGFTVARFRHRVSRADDPHLHTHALVANVARGPDGRDHALHSPLLYGERRGAGATYHAVLRHHLTVELGVTWTLPLGGRADMDLVPSRVRSAFSQRRAAVLAGSTGALMERAWAARVSRPPRDGRVEAGLLRAAWEGRRERLGWEVPRFGPGRTPAISAVDLGDVLPAPDRWTRSDLVVALADRWVDGAPAELLESTCDLLVRDGRVLPLGPPSGRHAATRFTTCEAMARQARVAAALGSPDAAVDVDERPESLDTLRQAVMARAGRLVVVVADPGGVSGLAHRVGAPTVAVDDAVAAMARLNLGAADLVVLRRPDRMASAAVEAVVDAAAIRRVVVVAAGRAHPRVAGVERSGPDAPRRGPGDTRLGAARVGGGRGGWVGPEVPGAVVAAPRGGPVATVGLRGGDLTAAGTAALAADTAIDDWIEARRRGRSGVLVADAAEVDDLAVRARTALRSAGLIGVTEVGGMAAGDVVWFSAARPSAGVVRHETAAVAAVGPAVGGVRLRLGDGRGITLGAGELGGVRQAHVVPPLPALFAGRGEVFVIGGRVVADRHLGGSELHRYVTVSVSAGAPLPSIADRRAPLAEIDACSRAIRERARLPADPAGRRRRLDERARLAREWLAQAEDLHRRAVAIGDPVASAAWAAQRHAAGTELSALAQEHVVLSRQELEYRERRRHTAPDRARLAALTAHATLRQAAVDLASGAEVTLERRWREGHVPLGRDLGLAL